MKLHDRTPIRETLKQRIGRSGKRGSYSGRGQKGQRSRSGHRIRPAERDIILKLPKLRGFRNKPKRDVPVVFNLSQISNKFKGGKAIVELDRVLFAKNKMIGKDYKGKIKILGTGEIAFAISVKGMEVSATAAAKIQKAGGSVQ
jgi:large subunit ribosomal protein L15